jgi:hypothetical protein
MHDLASLAAEARLARTVLFVFVVALLLAPFALRPKSPAWARALLIAAVIALLSRNPFGSDLAAAVFVVATWILAVLLALSVPHTLFVLSGWKDIPPIVIGALAVVSVTIPFVLRGMAPRRLSVGVPLAFLTGPWGQLYVEGSAVWVAVAMLPPVLFGLTRQLVWLTWPGAGGPPPHPLDLPAVWSGWAGLGFRCISVSIMCVRLTSLRTRPLEG